MFDCVADLQIVQLTPGTKGARILLPFQRAKRAGDARGWCWEYIGIPDNMRRVKRAGGISGASVGNAKGMLLASGA